MKVASPLSALIAEAKRELAMRERVYPNLVARAQLTQHQADERTALMRDILATLERLQAHMPLFRVLAREARIAAEHPGVAAVLDAFPGATITSIKRQGELL